MERKGREVGGKGKGEEGIGGTGDDLGWDGDGRERRKGREREQRGYIPKLQSWRRRHMTTYRRHARVR